MGLLTCACALGAVLLFSTLTVDASILYASFVCYDACKIQYEDVRGTSYTVGYDHRAVLINGQRTLLQSGCIHYPRSTPSMWPKLFNLTRGAHLNTVQTYVFWNAHELTQGHYDFQTGNLDLLKFLQDAADAGLFVTLRIGPYVCAEWTFGGIPIWLKDVPGISIRDYNQPWLDAMQTFVDYVVKLVDPYLARNGGPIILIQIENEYGNIESAYPNHAKYVEWAASLAVSYKTDTPWIMCQQGDAPNIVINTCNGFYCDNWLPGHFSSFPDQPALWTENWPGWFQSWGEPVPHRPVEDVSFAVARFIMRGGMHHNYYMWHGGSTFGRWVGGPNIITSYDYDVALNEYGVPSEPKYSHSARLHQVLVQYASALAAVSDVPPTQSLGTWQEAIQYGGDGADGTVIFLASIDSTNDVNVTYQGHSYLLPAWSVSIVDGKTMSVVYNTAQLSSDILTPKPIKDFPVVATVSRTAYIAEPIGTNPKSKTVTNPSPLEQIHTTQDTTDYLWYQTQVSVDAGVTVVDFAISFTYDNFYVYVDGVLVAHSRGVDNLTHFNISNIASTHTLSILTLTDGLQNYGDHQEKITRGILGTVMWQNVDITTNSWLHTIGLLGEVEQYYSLNSSTVWGNNVDSVPAAWYQAILESPADLSRTYALDMTSSMTKGMVWVNGYMIGRYWNIVAVGICGSCNYRGTYEPLKCRTGCGEPSQRYYHVPVEWLSAPGQNNTIVVYEEQSGVPSQITLVATS